MAIAEETRARMPAADPVGPAAIAVEHLVKFYKTTRAVDGVSFGIARGSITGLLGGNGAGKTTTIAMIMGLVLPTSGRIQVLGHSIPDESDAVLGRMNFESPYVDMPMRLTVRQNLTIFGRLYAVENLSSRIEQLAADLDLNDFLDRANGKLSAGQKTRVALAKALINEPELPLLDEPTVSLDPDTGDWVRSYLETYRERTGATILLASHNMGQVERRCSQVFMQRKARIGDFVSPLRPYEWVLSLLAMSFIRVMLGILPAALLAIPLYHYSIFTLGLPLIAFFALLLVMGWAVGLAIIALILRHGLGAENLAWVAIFVLSPISGIYYPISVLP